MALTEYGWILAIITIAFLFSSFGNGANDVANSYATSVAARTLTMAQAGVLAFATEFIGAVALGARVTNSIKNNIIDPARFKNRPGAFMAAMGCAEVGSATWLMVASRFGLPVSTTHTIVGSLVGVGIASSAPVSWGWSKGSVSQIAVSWVVSPALSAAFAAIIFLTLKYSVLERQNSLDMAMRLIPFYLAFTASILALFLVIEAPAGASLEELGAGRCLGIILGSFFGVLLIAYVFFKPYFHRRVIRNDSRVRWWHIPLGPTLMKEDPWLPFAGRSDGDAVADHYAGQYVPDSAATASPASTGSPVLAPGDSHDEKHAMSGATDSKLEAGHVSGVRIVRRPEPEERFLGPTKHLPIYHPSRLWSWTKYLLLAGVTREVVMHSNEHLKDTHARAPTYDNRVEHLWTYAQVASAMMMSIAHGSNDVANAVGPWAATYDTYRLGAVTTKAATPVWILCVAGFMLAAGFWFFGYHVVRSLGNRITRMSPTRGYSAELGAAIAVLLASRLALPVSTTQCLCGAVIGVGLMNFSVGAVNWRQVLWIASGWVATLPIAGLISGLLCAMALNAPNL